MNFTDKEKDQIAWINLYKFEVYELMPYGKEGVVGVYGKRWTDYYSDINRGQWKAIDGSMRYESERFYVQRVRAMLRDMITFDRVKMPNGNTLFYFGTIKEKHAIAYAQYLCSGKRKKINLND